MRVLSSRAIWIGAVVVLSCAVVMVAVLLSTFGSGTPQDRARLEAVRLTATMVVGAGGGIALLLAARRQRTSELALLQTRHDADERRVTELYGSALEQLGSDKAAVRLGGLYALQRLAQDHPGHRQMIVEVLCAYLRMPPPAADTADEEARHRAAEENRVRRATQHILAVHLTKRNDDGAANPAFWPDIDLYLAGAHLYRWNFRGCHVRQAVFTDAEFEGSAMFREAVFHAGALFTGAQLDHAMFGAASFHGSTDFQRARLHDTCFAGTRFTGPSTFDRANLDDADFTGATFTTQASWPEAELTDAAFGPQRQVGDLATSPPTTAN